MRAAVLVVLLVSCVACGVKAYGEADASGSPVWQERANHVLVNAVRLNPSAYRTSYMVGSSPDPSSILTSSYPAVPPVYMAPQLDASASNHTWDMINSGKFQHDSSDGTPCFTRVGSFYNCSGTMGENIAAGYADPLQTNNQWLCDSTGSACAADKSGSDGHRSNIMGSGYKAIGVGFGSKSGTAYTNYWTQDFGGATCNPVVTNPIYGGSHIYTGTSNANIKYLAAYYTSQASAPSAAKVVVDGTAYDLSYELGMQAGQGIYSLTQTNPKACKNYYFQFTNSAGVTSRFPESGFLVTYLTGTCTTSFTTAGSASTSAPSTSTSAPSTNAPTTTTTTTTRTPTTTSTTSAPVTTSTNTPSTSAPTTTTNTPTTNAPTTNAPTTTTTRSSTSAPTTTKQASTTIRWTSTGWTRPAQA